MKVLSILSSLVLFDLSSSDPSPSWGAIVGGTNVTEVEYPTYDYQVELDIFLEDGRVLGCGGTKVRMGKRIEQRTSKPALCSHRR